MNEWVDDIHETRSKTRSRSGFLLGLGEYGQKWLNIARNLQLLNANLIEQTTRVHELY